MTLTSALIKAITDPTDPDELYSPYLAGYQDAYVEVKHRVLRALATCDEHIYTLAPTPTGFALTRIRLDTLAVPAPLPVQSPEPDSGTRDADPAF
jgi:hypothetical protein